MGMAAMHAHAYAMHSPYHRTVYDTNAVGSEGALDGWTDRRPRRGAETRTAWMAPPDGPNPVASGQGPPLCCVPPIRGGGGRGAGGCLPVVVPVVAPLGDARDA